MKLSEILGIPLTDTQAIMAIPIPYNDPEHKPGDFRLTYDRSKVDEVAVARETFDKWRRKGYMAYRVTGAKAEKGDILHEFDPEARSIIFAPPMQGGKR